MQKKEEPYMCDVCHQTPASHDSYLFGITIRQCCRCYVLSGSPPSDWHYLCMETYYKQMRERGVVQKFPCGSRVRIKDVPHWRLGEEGPAMREATVIKADFTQYVLFVDGWGRMAWFSQNDLEVLE